MTLVILAVCAVGFTAAVWPAFDGWLSFGFAIAYSVAGAVALLALVVKEVRYQLWWMGLGTVERPARAKRARAPEDAEQS